MKQEQGRLRRVWEKPLVQRVARKAPIAAQYFAWHCVGRPVPATPGVKQHIVSTYGHRFGLTTLVETGTLFGDMLAAMKTRFDRLYSVELDPELYRRARDRFAADPQVTLLQGDSGVVLNRLLPEIRTPCLFWLDGHWSGGITGKGERETPIRAEADAIAAHPCRDHVVLVDDARCFTGEGDYPTLDQIREMFCANRPDLNFEVRDDVIRIHRPTGRGT